MKIGLVAQTLGYPEGGGHFWVYLNWALGLQAIGVSVIWLETVDPAWPPERVAFGLGGVRSNLSTYGFHGEVALLSSNERPLHSELDRWEVQDDASASCDLLMNFRYGLPASSLRRFRRTALIDIDPGLFQHWVSRKQMTVAPHDFYFTTGEWIGDARSKVPDLGWSWHHTLPCVFLDPWPVQPHDFAAPFTTVSHWQTSDFVQENDGSGYSNSKRSGFMPFLELPQYVDSPLELALCLCNEDEDDRRQLVKKGWRVRHAYEVAGSPSAYRSYIQRSFGEFSATKPSCQHFGTAWISDRTICYLASGRPAVVQFTGESSILPNHGGLWRFQTLSQAAAAIRHIQDHYEEESRLARALAEETFAARRVTRRLLETALS